MIFSRFNYLFFLIAFISNAQYYHVSVHGNDSNPGTEDSPLKTISKAAKIALPGDVITVHEGTYREWVRPENGGLNDQDRIIYQA